MTKQGNLLMLMSMMKSRIGSFLAVVALAWPAGLLLAAPADAVTIGFDCLTNSIAGDCAIGEAQLTVDVTDAGGSQVSFTFQNSGPDASAISEIYFDDGTLLGISSVTSGPGVDYVTGANPMNLPGANLADPDFEVTAGFLAESTPAPPINGVGPGEWVTIVFDLMGGGSFADVISELTTGELRIGIHVIAFTSGGSESFINPPIPEPGTALLMGLGLAALGYRRRATR